MKQLSQQINYYIRVYKALIRINLAKLLTYRAELINSGIAHTIWASFTVVQMLLLTSKTSQVFGWSRDELLVLAGMYNIVMSFFYMFFSRGFNAFSTTIHLGRLDAILTKPIDSQFLMTCMFITYTHLIRLVTGVAFVIVMLVHMKVQVTLFTLLELIVVLGFAIMVVYCFWMLIMTLTIWYPKLSNLTDLLYQVNQVSKFPQEIYKGVSIYLLLFLFPLTVTIVTPTKAILQQMQFRDFSLVMVCAVVMFFVSRKFWYFALKSYTSASG